jgi:hypothetical protein
MKLRFQSIKYEKIKVKNKKTWDNPGHFENKWKIQHKKNNGAWSSNE